MTKINRREWIKSSSMVSGGLILTPGPFTGLLSQIDGKTGRKIEEIHIINLTHTDFGYTDLPSSVWDYLVKNIHVAMAYSEETAGYPPEAQFKWTIESMWILERFWNQASQVEKDRFDKLVQKGLIEVMAMPGNMTCLVDSYEWENELNRLSFFYEKYKPKIAIQNDVNGLPLGLIDSLAKRNVKKIIMGANGYYSVPPVPVPSFFRWEGKNNNSLLMYSGEGYTSAFNYFQNQDFRRGPVPNRWDLWYNPPTGNEIFSSEKKEILAGYEILKKRLERLNKAGYPYSTLLLQFTNHWTMDNDVPCRQLSEFIKTYNEMGLEPRLVFSTPTAFFEKIVPEMVTAPVTLKGEWCDWWGDGIAGSPFEISLLQGAKRRNRDIGNALDHFNGSTPSLKKMLEELNHDLVFAAEHTFGAYDSVAHPYNERSNGNHIQKFDPVYRADENSKRIVAELIRSSKYYMPFSQTRKLEVYNPGFTTRSNWVEISATAVRTEANSVKDSETGRVYRFEETLGSEWASAEGASPSPAEIPNDVWPFRPAKYRFFLENIKPGETKKFELLQLTDNQKKPVTESRYFLPVVDEVSGQVKNIIYKPLNKPVFDESASAKPAQLVIERLLGTYPRTAIAARTLDQKYYQYKNPVIKNSEKVDSEYAIRYTTIQEEDFAKRIEQQWDIYDNIPRIEITTTIWMKENLDPIAAYLAFPFAVSTPRAFYRSLGELVEVGVDQMPNTCGEYNTIQNGVSYNGQDISIALSSPDLPLGIFDSIVRGRKRTVFKPQTGHFYNLVFQNYWITNFDILRPAKLVIRHTIECDIPGASIQPLENNEVWAYPSV
jgi:hypothetical protein